MGWFQLNRNVHAMHAAKLNEQLTVGNIATRPEQMNIPGWQYLALTGDLLGHWDYH